MRMYFSVTDNVYYIALSIAIHSLWPEIINSRTMASQDYISGPDSTIESVGAIVAVGNSNSQLSKQPQDKTRSASLKFKFNWRKFTETILLVFVLIIVWCLFAIPTVLYAISASQSSQVRCIRAYTEHYPSMLKCLYVP